MEELALSFDQLSRGVNVILQVTSKQRTESLKVAKHADVLRKENASLQDENQGLLDQNESLQGLVKSHKRSWEESESENKNLGISLKLARAQLLKEEERLRELDGRRQKAETKCKTLERQVNLIRELVLSEKKGSKDWHNNPQLAELEIMQQTNEPEQDHPCDPTDMSIDPDNHDLSGTGDLDGSLLRSGRKWRRSFLQQTYQEDGESEEENMSPPKKRSTRRSSTNTVRMSGNTPSVNIVTHTKIDFSPPRTDHVLSNHKRNQGSTQPGRRPPTRKSRTLSEESDDVVVERHGSEPSAPAYYDLYPECAVAEPQLDLDQPMMSSLKRQASCASIQTLVESRPHDFSKKSVMTRESCQGCQQNIKFASAVLKCKECRAVCHEQCRDNCPLPCVPVAQTPQSKQAVKDGSLESFAPRRPPFVPSLVIHCSKEVEKRGLQEQGIYRLSGKDKSIKELKTKLLKGTKGASSQVMSEDIHAVACTLKLFFRELREPLIPGSHFESFLEAMESDNRTNRDCMVQFAVRALPNVNQHTLAYMALHLLRVSECYRNKMNISNLCTVFAPTLIGTAGEQTASTMLADVDRQRAIMDALLGLEPQFWSDILNEGEAATGAGGSPVGNHAPSPFGNQRVGSPRSSPTGSPQGNHHPRQAQLVTPVHLRKQSSTSSPPTPDTKAAPDIASVLGPITSSAQQKKNGAPTPRRALRKRQGGFFSTVKGSAV